MTLFGLVGKNIGYSFSKNYFTEKFQNLGLKEYFYQNFDLETIDTLPEIIAKNPDLQGFNVTIPYKEKIIQYLDAIDDEAQKIGAVNVVKITNDRKLIGYNTDFYGFSKSLESLLTKNHKKALILGNGGASKAIFYALEQLKIPYTIVSRTKNATNITYTEIDKKIILEHQIIINATPLGTFPNVDNCPDIPYNYLNNNHLCYDLIYNPSESLFLKLAKEKGALTKNGLEMLQLQAEKSWEIWQK